MKLVHIILLRTIKVRKTSESGQDINWNDT